MSVVNGGKGGNRADLERRHSELMARIDMERRRLIEQAQELRRPLRNIDRVGAGLREMRRAGGLPLLILPGAVMLWRARPLIRIGMRAWATWKLLRRMAGKVRGTLAPGRNRGGRHADRRTTAGGGSLRSGLLLIGTLAGGLLARRLLSRKSLPQTGWMHKEQRA